MTEHSPGPSVGLSVFRSVGLSDRKVYCGKTAEWIRMPFGMVNGVGRGMGVLDGGGDRRRRRAVFGVNFERLIVTNVDLATQLFPNYFGQDNMFSIKPVCMLKS